ncbi:MAG: gliding motility-associated C-terminal domain-containing protein [Bacteroidota bacterium]
MVKQTLNRFLYLLVFLLVFACQNPLFGTHNRAGEITYVQTGPLTIEATILTYTKASSTNVDRDSLRICWGDGNCEMVGRSNGPNNNGEILLNDIKRNTYVAIHTYPAQGHYVISMNDPNRNEGILNIDNSVNVPFHLETTVTLFNPQFEGFNSSPRLFLPPTDIACLNQPFVHNPTAFDPDGDSLAYRLIVPMQAINTPIVGYSFPDQVSPDPVENQIFFSELTGEFRWDSPQRLGEYNIAMYIIEYRNGNPIDTMIRDMQILVEDCENMPPEIETIEEICVIAGESVSIDIRVTAPLEESDQRVALEAYGGPLNLDISPARLDVLPGFQDQPLRGVFRWQTACEHISDQFYTVTFRAIDDFRIKDTLNLSSLHLLRIKVVGPPPEDVQTVEVDGEIEVSWENPYVCEDAADEYFRGFSVWRREGSNNFPIDTCMPGLAGRGYIRLNTALTREIVDGRYFYLDTDIDKGRTYCYRILAEFAKTSAGGFPFNIVESLPSEESCVQLKRDIPLLTKVSVDQTDMTQGEMQLEWVLPQADALDTILNPGPYRIELLRTDGFNNSGFQPVPGADFSSPTFAGFNDISFTDVQLNTVGQPYTYQLAFYVNNETDPLGFSAEASSVFLTVASTDEQNTLSWEASVPWNNFRHVIYRQNASMDWDSIGTTVESSYEDIGLRNGQEYCYYVETIGTYGIDGIPSPLRNLSQEACGVPLDSIAPCPPELMVTNICDDNEVNCVQDVLTNTLNWTHPIDACPTSDDVVSYNVYFAPIEGAEFGQIGQTLSPDSLIFEHNRMDGFAGCYAVTAIDSVGNESELSNIVCVDNCPVYVLPNVFTPNNDGANERFIPLSQCFVDRVEFKVFNRWGQVVFQTNDPSLQWDGRNQSGTELAEGVYYYVCKYFEERVGGVVPSQQILSGYIELLR